MVEPDRQKVKLNARVPPAKKEEWLDSLEEGETLNSLVQRAVDREIRGEYVHVETLEEVSGKATSDVDFSEVTERLDELQGTVESLHREIDAVASTGSSYDTERVSEVAMNLMDHIPSWFPQNMGEETIIKDEDEKLDVVHGLLKDDLRMGQELTKDGSVDRLASEVGESPVLVRQALIYLEQNTTADIGSIVVDGTRHWVEL